MRILLINGKDETSLYHYKKKSFNLGLLSIFMQVRDTNEVGFVDLNFEDTLIEVLLHKHKPDLVALSCYSSNRHHIFDICKRIKQYDKSIYTVLGGYHATFLYKQILKNYPVDFIIVGEGEQAFKKLADALSTNKPTYIAGIASKNGNKIIHKEQDKHIDIDSLPVLDYKPYLKYLKNKKARKEFIPVFSFSRGCPYNCKFCNQYVCSRYTKPGIVKASEQWDNLVRTFPHSRIIVSDNNFYLNKKSISQMAEHIKERGYDNPLIVRGRVDNLNQEIVKILKSINTTNIFLGVESGNQRVLDKNNKKIKLGNVVKAFSLIRKNRMDSSAYFIIGLPGDTYRTIRQTSRFIDKIRPNNLVIRKCCLTPGSKLYDECVKTGKFNENQWLKKDNYFFYKESIPIPVLEIIKQGILFKHKTSLLLKQ